MNSVIMKRQRLKTPIMLKHITHWQFKAILLTGILSIPNLLALENYNFQRERYDYIDVAKEAPRGRSKGQTTRIFTTDDGLDEKFWLKYLGEDIRNAVHLQVDDNNNVIPVKDIKRQQYPTVNYDAREEKHARFVRQSAQDVNKQEPVEMLDKQDAYQYPTEEPQTFNLSPATTLLPTPQTRREHYNTQINVKGKRLAKHMDKLPMNNIYKQRPNNLNSPRTFKAIHEPIVVNLPEMENSEHQINDEHVPLVVQIPPIIYHRKAEYYPESNLHE